MSYTNEDILKITNGLIDFQKIARELELDLNNIAQVVLERTPEYPQNMIEFIIFTDFERYNRHIKLQAPGEGSGFRKTPVMLHRFGGDFATEKGPKIYTFTLGLEAYGFENDRNYLYQIFSTLAELKHGKVVELAAIDGTHNGSVVQIFNLPSFGNPIQESGMNRIEVGLEFSLTYVYDGLMFNQNKISLNGHKLDALQMSLTRSRAISSGQKNSESDIGVVNKSQALVLSLMMVYDKTPATKMVFDNIRKLGAGLNTAIDVTVEYLDETPDNYRMVITDGTISGMAGGYLVLECVMNLAPIKR